ncbi:MAG: tocopherol cyclase family protein [Thermoleophilia bacterium]
MTGWWRRHGADLPWHDPRGAHGVGMEGYYWRLVTDSGRVVIALCGATGDRALVALAASPGGVTWRIGGPVRLDRRGLGVDAGGLMTAGGPHLRVDLGPAERLEAVITGAGWPRRLSGLGLGGMVPGLSQYWHPHVLGGRAEGTLTLGGRAETFTGTAYAEKNWGPGFPERWWWGEAHDGEVTAAFAGGSVRLGPVHLHATTAVVVVDGRVVQLALPLALVRTRAGEGAWRVRGRDAVHRLEIDAEGGPAPALRLPVPPRTPGGAVTHVDQFARGVMRVRLWRGRRLVVDRELAPAGLEAGTA